MQFLKSLIFPGGFMPHGYCYLWTYGLAGLHEIADSVIAVSYLSIALRLLCFIRKRQSWVGDGLPLPHPAETWRCNSRRVPSAGWGHFFLHRAAASSRDAGSYSGPGECGVRTEELEVLFVATGSVNAERTRSRRLSRSSIIYCPEKST